MDRDLSRIDLNLLVHLDLLLQEENVSRAARRAGLTQPSMSRSLARLREIFSDPLLVRADGRTQSTPFARSIAEPLAVILHDISARLLVRRSYDPRSDARQWNIGTSAFPSALLMDVLVARCRREAPSLRLELTTPGPGFAQELVEGRLDLALGGAVEERAGLHGRTLFRDRFVCLADGDHPALASGPSLEDYLAFPHAVVSVAWATHSPIDEALDQLGLRRTVAVRTDSFLLVPLLLRSTDLLTTLPSLLARRLAAIHGLRMAPCPLPLAGFAMRMFWHERYHDDAAHRWLREALQIVAETVQGSDADPDLPKSPSGGDLEG